MNKFWIKYKKIISEIMLKTLISIAALTSVGVLPYALKLNESHLFVSNSFLSIVIYMAIWYLLYRTERILNKRLFVISLIAGGVGSFILIIGSKLYLYEASGLGSVFTYLQVVGFLPVMMSIFAFVIHYYDYVMERLKCCWLERKCARFVKGDKKFFLLVWIGTFICWIPGLLASFPGIYGYDSIYQVQWFMTGEMSSAHPILHTYLLGGCIKLGREWLGSYEMGMLLYSLLQMVFLSAVFAYISKIICKWLPAILQIMVILSYAFLPYNVLFSFSSTKDVIYAGLFAILVLKTYCMVSDMDEFFRNWRKQAEYIVTIFFMCTFRYNGYYAFLFMVPFFIILCRKYWKNAIVISVVSILIWNIYIGPVHAALGLKQGSNSSMLSVPTQQLARAMRDNSGELEKDEIKMIKEYLPDYELYLASSSDYIKATFNETRFDQNPAEFLQLWISVGLKHPLTYIDAFASETLGYWYPDMVYPDPGAGHPYIEYNNTDNEGDWIKIQRTSYIPILSKVYGAFAYSTLHQNIPAFSMLFSPGFVFWMIGMAICRCFYTKRYTMLLPCSIMVGLWLTLLLGPVVLLRYAYPFFTCVPVLLCVSMNPDNLQETKGESL